MLLGCKEAIVPRWQSLEHVSQTWLEDSAFQFVLCLDGCQILRFCWKVSHFSQMMHRDKITATKFSEIHKFRNATIVDRGPNQGHGENWMFSKCGKNHGWQNTHGMRVTL